MKVHLMYPDRDFRPGSEAPGQWNDVCEDLGVGTLLDAMAGGDPFLRGVADAALRTGLDRPGDIGYRQDVLADCAANAATVRAMYALAVEAIAGERRVLRGFLRNPDVVLRHAVDALTGLMEAARQVRQLAADLEPACRSQGMTGLVRRLTSELDDPYLAEVEEHLQNLRFRRGVLVSARLGPGNKAAGYVLRRPDPGSGWARAHLPGTDRWGHTVHIAERDEAGAQALSELRERGVNLAANALAQSADHVLGFFQQLRAELGFYLGCQTLRDRLAAAGAPVCRPEPAEAGSGAFSCAGLYDVALWLLSDGPVVGNDIDADGQPLLVLTGANQGGKSTLLRAVGLAQLMMQAGMFVPAGQFRAAVRPQVFTHFRRGEDRTMESGKLDEELARMSSIVDRLRRHDLLLCNEPFASTTEREGADIARGVLHALVDSDVTVVLVTHLFELAHGLERDPVTATLFLRAERQPDGKRTYRLLPGSPLPTSYGPDLYQRIFDDGPTAQPDPGPAALDRGADAAVYSSHGDGPRRDPPGTTPTV